MNKKRILIDLDLDVHTKLNKMARSKASRLKPFIELILLNFCCSEKQK